MRSKLFLFVIPVMILTSCQLLGSNSHKHNLSHNSGTTIVGQWQWLKTTGGFMGATYTPKSKGYGHYTISFSSEFNYSEMREDTIVYSGTYSLTKNNDKTVLQLHAPGITTFDKNVTIQNNDTLILMDQCFDCFISTYKRVN